jgi:hypothetical protein
LTQEAGRAGKSKAIAKADLLWLMLTGLFAQCVKTKKRL